MIEEDRDSGSLLANRFKGAVDDLMIKARHIMGHAARSGRSEARLNITGEGVQEVEQVRSKLLQKGYVTRKLEISPNVNILVIKRLKLAS